MELLIIMTVYNRFIRSIEHCHDVPPEDVRLLTSITEIDY